MIYLKSALLAALGEDTIHQFYDDILDRIPEEPVWFDENAVPRFCEFSPQSTAYIYGGEAALVLIECQNCTTEFKVAFTEWNLRHELWVDTQKQIKNFSDLFKVALTVLFRRNKLAKDSKKKIKNISDLIANGSIHYGDPPHIGCCAAGPTMNSVPIRVLEYWYKPVVRGEGVKDGLIVGPGAMDFRRDPEFEIEIPDCGLRAT